jgi:hypothetical protein
MRLYKCRFTIDTQYFDVNTSYSSDYRGLTSEEFDVIAHRTAFRTFCYAHAPTVTFKSYFLCYGNYNHSLSPVSLFFLVPYIPPDSSHQLSDNSHIVFPR